MPEPARDSTVGQRNIEREVEHEVSELLAELAQMSRQISNQLDARAARLQDLLRQADERIELLSSLTQEQAQISQPNAHLIDPAPALAPAPETTDGVNADVYALADEGRTPQEIAARLDRPKGEIELILALRRR